MPRPSSSQLAERLSAPVATTISGKGSIDEQHPLAVGVVGSNGGTPETRAIVDQADLVVFIGCRAGSVTTERWRHPAPGSSKMIHLDVDPAVPGTNYPADAALVGDAKLGLKMLNEALAATSPAARRRARGSSERTEIRQIPSARGVQRNADQTRARGRRADASARPGRNRGRRRRHALPVSFRLLSGARQRQEIYFQPRPRRARLLDGGRHGRALRAAESRNASR